MIVPDVLRVYRERFVYVYTVTGFVALFAFGVVPHASHGNRLLALFEAAVAVALIINLLSYRKHKNYTLLSNVAHFLILLTFDTLVVTGGYRGTGIFWVFSYPLLSFFLTRKKEVIMWNSALILSLIGLYAIKPTLFYYDFVVLRQALGAYVSIFILAFAYNSVVSNLIRMLSQKASVDMLTGLYSRSFFLESLDRTLARVKRHRNQSHLLVYLDLDNFKSVNDTYGHHVGDYVLREVAHLIRFTFRKGDVISRFGGDEFMILAYGADKEGIEKRLHLLRERIEERFSVYGISVSWGIAQIPDDGLDVTELIKKADERMYKMKAVKKV